MKYLKSALTTIVSSLIVATAAFALPVPSEPWDPSSASDPLNLYEIYNEVYGTSLTSNTELEAFAIEPGELFECLYGGGQVDVVARFAGFGQAVGFYTESGDSIPVSAIGTGLSSTGSLSLPAGVVGLYDQVTGAGNPRWYSEAALNGGDDHMVAYWGQNGDIFIGFEDRAFTDPFADFDYNDLVLTITCNVVPEPASVVLLGMALAGLVSRKLIRK